MVSLLSGSGGSATDPEPGADGPTDSSTTASGGEGVSYSEFVHMGKVTRQLGAHAR
eukprot:SAG22_NODE_2869_length_2139_cov_2.178431_2_plen_56_part_00